MFSVIITTCNREPHIVEEAIKSVLNQSYKKIELIIVNDAPQYYKRSELEEMIAAYSNKVKYFVNNISKGANFSRNFGALNSTGEYLSFLDDDDYWDLERVLKVVKVFEKGADIVYSDFFIFSNKGKIYSKRLMPEKSEAVKEMLAFNFLGGFSNVSIRKTILEKVGMLNESLPAYQDQDLFIRLVQCGTLGYIPEPLSYYRITQNSISLNGCKKMEGLLTFLDNYNHLYLIHPESKRKRLESELVYAEKQGWKENAAIISKLLIKLESPIKIFILRIKGKLKYIAVRYLKLQ